MHPCAATPARKQPLPFAEAQGNDNRDTSERSEIAGDAQQGIGKQCVNPADVCPRSPRGRGYSPRLLRPTRWKAADSESGRPPFPRTGDAGRDWIREGTSPNPASAAIKTVGANPRGRPADQTTETCTNTAGKTNTPQILPFLVQTNSRTLYSNPNIPSILYIHANPQQNLAYSTAADLLNLIKTKQVSPVELVELFLQRIDDLDHYLNSYLLVTDDIALRQAKAAENAIMRGDDLGPLHGLPIPIKDNQMTGGIRTTAVPSSSKTTYPKTTPHSSSGYSKAAASSSAKQTAPNSDSWEPAPTP